MKKKEWNEGLDHLDPDLVEQYVEQKDQLRQRKKARGIWLRIGTIAACFLVVVSAITVMPRLWRDDPIDPPSPDTTGGEGNPNISIVNLQAPSSAPQYYGKESSQGAVRGTQAELNTAGLSVTAQFVEALPDTYTFFSDWDQTEFRLLRMKTVSLLKGQEMTDEFYYIIPIDFMTDYSIYDNFVIIDMAQYGYELSVVYNKTHGCAERLELVLFGYTNISLYFSGVNMMAFDSDGRFDMRLWNATEEWTEGTSHTVEYYGAEHYQNYTRQQAEEEARQDYYDDFYVHLLEDISGNAAEVLSQIFSFDNGIYVPSSPGSLLYLSPEVQLSAVRYIDGFATNERVSIKSKEWNGGDQDIYAYTKARFSEDDLNALPNLSSAIAAISSSFDAGELIPPHIQNHSEMKNTVHGIFGWYAKTEAGVLGIVRVTWCYLSDNYDLCFDDAYYVIEYGSDECRPIDRDALLERLGEYEKTYIYTGEYDENGKVFERTYPIP